MLSIVTERSTTIQVLKQLFTFFLLLIIILLCITKKILKKKYNYSLIENNDRSNMKAQPQARPGLAQARGFKIINYKTVVCN